MSTVVSRGIRTHVANEDYRAGHVFTFRRCPECNAKVDVRAEDEYSMEFSCACGVEGTVDLRGDHHATIIQQAEDEYEE